MTTAELDELERLEREATPGPWYCTEHVVETLNGRVAENLKTSHDTTLIAAARNALPTLIAAARENAALKEKAPDCEIAEKLSDDAHELAAELSAKLELVERERDQLRTQLAEAREQGRRSGIESAANVASTHRGKACDPVGRCIADNILALLGADK